MSITVRRWDDDELEAVDRCKTDKDKALATILMNTKSLYQRELDHYPYDKRRTYICDWMGEPEVIIYATDERMLLRFIDWEYVSRPDCITQKITQYRPVKF